MSAITFFIPQASLLCSSSSITILLYCTCPLNKQLEFIYPNNELLTLDAWAGRTNPTDPVDNEPLLIELPRNYRPPSPRGKIIPLTSNIYNADPATEIPSDYRTSVDSRTFDQCDGRSQRADCGCTDEMKASSLAKFTDCKERVLRLRFQGRLQVTLLIRQDDESHEDEMRYVKIIEVNGRVDWILKSNRAEDEFLSRTFDDKKRALEETNETDGREYRMITKVLNPNNMIQYSNADDLQISMRGSELYHFRATIIEGISYCSLETEFQAFITLEGLAHPVHYMIYTCVALFGGLILLATFAVIQKRLREYTPPVRGAMCIGTSQVRDQWINKKIHVMLAGPEHPEYPIVRKNTLVPPVVSRTRRDKISCGTIREGDGVQNKTA